MKTGIQRSDSGTDGSLQRYDYEDATLLVADLGSASEGTSVDVVDGTAIIVTETGEQREFDLPTREATATINNGVFTIEVAR